MHPSARILIAGQAPGRRAHERGVPFDDPSGERLRDWLGVDKATFYDASRIAILPMGFCFPGTGKGGDLPPRAECAPAWRKRLLKSLPNIELTLVIGRYAHQWHLGERQSATLTETVADWRAFWPAFLPLPHPSPRNVRWIRQNAWFEKEVLPVLVRRVEELLSH
jgi:uracil-DNA glycosylase